MIRFAAVFKGELRTLLLNSGDPQSSPAHFLNSDSQGSPKFTRAPLHREGNQAGVGIERQAQVTGGGVHHDDRQHAEVHA